VLCCSALNLKSYQESSRLLSSLCVYHYTRKAWRKDVLELFLDGSFFQMNFASLSHWKVIIDHLVTNDKVIFRDILGEE
jgi:hypothetical protein